MEERELFDILKLVTDFLNKEKIPYMIVGGITLAYHGLPRTTEDIDILIFLEEHKIKKFADFMEKNDFLIEEEEIKAALKEKSHFSVFDNKSIFRIDIKGVYDDLDRDSFSRRKNIHFMGLNLFINTPEDAIIAKLVFGSYRDLEDAKGIILRHGKELDLNYIKDKCKKHKVLDKLEKILKDANNNNK